MSVAPGGRKFEGTLKQQITLTMSGTDLQRIREFQAAEEFPTIQSAARALMLTAIDAYPKVGVFREARLTAVHLARQKILARVLRVFTELTAEFEAEAPVDRDAEATIEKGTVTFTREDQE